MKKFIILFMFCLIASGVSASVQMIGHKRMVIGDSVVQMYKKHIASSGTYWTTAYGALWTTAYGAQWTETYDTETP